MKIVFSCKKVILILSDLIRFFLKSLMQETCFHHNKLLCQCFMAGNNFIVRLSNNVLGIVLNSFIGCYHSFDFCYHFCPSDMSFQLTFRYAVPIYQGLDILTKCCSWHHGNLASKLLLYGLTFPQGILLYMKKLI